MMFRDFTLTFSEKSAETLKKCYSEASLIIEYGTGGSTFYAAKEGKKVLAVESSIEWLMELMGAYKEQDLPGDIVPLWIDIGPTKQWGFPAEEGKWKNWQLYPNLPWQYCAEHQLDPDLILIDGRFRVACFVASCVRTRKPARVLIDDYAGRDYYHCISKIIKPTEIVADRLAVFDIQPDMIDSRLLIELLPYFNDPR